MFRIVLLILLRTFPMTCRASTMRLWVVHSLIGTFGRYPILKVPSSATRAFSVQEGIFYFFFFSTCWWDEPFLIWTLKRGVPWLGNCDKEEQYGWYRCLVRVTTGIVFCVVLICFVSDLAYNFLALLRFCTSALY